jgi:homoserine O-succinyltransferase
MPASAFKATERQFTALLNAASAGISVRLALYTLPGVRSVEASGHHAGYASVETLRGARLDGLIVTGTEPISVDLKREPYWEGFARLVEWARENTYSAVWSCLAAHAAVLHMDGIGRRKSEEKHFGIFDCASVAKHSLTAGVPRRFKVPHSRWNGLSEEQLTARGYRVLTRSSGAEVDTFVKQEDSLFVFFQGHPEYESDTLMREYRRDAGRYLRHEASKYPSVPHGYFDAKTEATLGTLRERALASRSKEVQASLARALEETEIKNTWHGTATRIYGNWLEHLCACKSVDRRAAGAEEARAG